MPLISLGSRLLSTVNYLLLNFLLALVRFSFCNSLILSSINADPIHGDFDFIKHISFFNFDIVSEIKLFIKENNYIGFEKKCWYPCINVYLYLLKNLLTSNLILSPPKPVYKNKTDRSIKTEPLYANIHIVRHMWDFSLAL